MTPAPRVRAAAGQKFSVSTSACAAGVVAFAGDRSGLLLRVRGPSLVDEIRVNRFRAGAR
jgi:hypothetical protein